MCICQCVWVYMCIALCIRVCIQVYVLHVCHIILYASYIKYTYLFTDTLRGIYSGINRKLQMKPDKWNKTEGDEVSKDTPLRATEVLLIIKWGGDLTPLGRQQAEDLGEHFRYNVSYSHSSSYISLCLSGFY